MTPPVLILPGLGTNGPTHWQTLWAAEEGFTCVDQESFDAPELEKWLINLKAAVQASPTPPVLVAHSLGCDLTAHYLQEEGARGRIAGAFLVCPVDIDGKPGLPITGFRPSAKQPLGVPVTIVRSATDPYVTIEESNKKASAWGVSGSAVITAEAGGHINVDAGCGPWPEGRELLSKFLASL